MGFILVKVHKVKLANVKVAWSEDWKTSINKNLSSVLSLWNHTFFPSSMICDNLPIRNTLQRYSMKGFYWQLVTWAPSA